MSSTNRLLPSLLIAASMCGVCAAAADPFDQPLRVVGEVQFGTAGFEPGVAAEWEFNKDAHLQLRPEVFISEDGRPGVALSLDWRLGIPFPEGQNLVIGPRVVYHNSDDYGWGGDLIAIYSIDLVPSMRGHHFLEVIGTVGAIEDRRDDQNHQTRVSGSVGVAYAYQF